MLNLELARIVHEERQRGIDAHARTNALLESVGSRTPARAPSAPSVGAPRRRNGLSTSDGRP